MLCRAVIFVFVCCFVQASTEDASGECSAGEGSCPSSRLGVVAKDEIDLSWEPKTISVVLPCAGEEEFALKTIKSVSGSVPGGSGGAILLEIVVVDDGSYPPLEAIVDKDLQTKYNVKLVRHERAIGLMGAKSAGAAVATGDIIVFFDCHVAPQDDWYEKFLQASAVNYRRVVVPVITDLDIDTWKERRRAGGLAKCYLTWDGDFKWITSDQPYMPVLSGGLLGISRRWWNETGGYDSGMSGWGGENIDQSLRTWLCGGEIYAMSNAFVAHMWRTPNDPRTSAKYSVSGHQAVVNRARAILAWFGDYMEKAGEYPDMKRLGFGRGGKRPRMDVSELHAIRDKLQCRPMPWFLWRFRDIYVDGGLLPKKTFKIQEATTGLCLAFLGPSGTHPAGRATAALRPCDGKKLMHPDGTRWHLGNRIPKTGKCCSGLRNWNTDQCLTVPGNGGGASTSLQTGVCDVSGVQGYPWKFVEKHSTLMPGQIQFQGQCLTVNGEKKFVMAACNKMDGQGGRGPWKRFEGEVPIETELYEKALKEQPELFQ